jgi:hypothetical protein
LGWAKWSQNRDECKRENKWVFAHGIFLFALLKQQLRREGKVYTAHGYVEQGVSDGVQEWPI